MDQKGGWVIFPYREGNLLLWPSPPARIGREEKNAVIYLDQFPEALEIQTGSENHRRLRCGALRFANKEVILDGFPFLLCRAASFRHSKYYLCLPFL